MINIYDIHACVVSIVVHAANAPPLTIMCVQLFAGSPFAFNKIVQMSCNMLLIIITTLCPTN